MHVNALDLLELPGLTEVFNGGILRNTPPLDRRPKSRSWQRPHVQDARLICVGDQRRQT